MSHNKNIEAVITKEPAFFKTMLSHNKRSGKIK